MGLRYNEKGKYLRSFVAPESCFIDIMMNVGIIFYAAQQRGDEELYEKVLEHCLTTRRYLSKRRRQHRPRRDIRFGDGAVFAPDHPPGLAR